MTSEEVQRWLDKYIAAWASNEAEAIGELFTEDAVYSYRPWESDADTVRGRGAIVASWMESPDDPSSWEAEYHPHAAEGNRAVAVGKTRYFADEDEPERIYHNAFLLEFGEDGRCSTFREFWVHQKT